MYHKWGKNQKTKEKIARGDDDQSFIFILLQSTKFP